MAEDLFALQIEDDEAALPVVEATVAMDRALDGHLKGPVVVEVMPPEFDLPALTRFVPNAALKAAAETLAARALALDVTKELEAADALMVQLGGAIAAVEANFETPTSLAHKAHKWLTTTCGAWLKDPRAAKATVQRRIVEEQLRRQQVAEQHRRTAQRLADEQARRQAAQAAEEAAKAGAQPEVVETLQKQAATATAPPVAAAAPVPLASTTPTRTWKARLAGTPADADPHPAVKDLTPEQRLQVFQLLKAILDGRAPVAVIKELNWSYLDDRAAAEKRELALPGIEAYEDIAPRSKPARRK